MDVPACAIEFILHRHWYFCAVIAYSNVSDYFARSLFWRSINNLIGCERLAAGTHTHDFYRMCLGIEIPQINGRFATGFEVAWRESTE